MKNIFKKVKPISNEKNNNEKSLFPSPPRCLIIDSGKITLLWNIHNIPNIGLNIKTFIYLHKKRFSI